MVNENPSSANYNSQNQVEFAREMAKFLAKKKGYQMTPGMAVLPRSYMYAAPDLVDGLIQGRYQDQARQGEGDLLQDKFGDPHVPQGPTTVGAGIANGFGSTLKNMWQGGKKAAASVMPSSDGSSGDKSLITGSIDPTNPTPTPPDSPSFGVDDLNIPKDNPWKTEVKRSENEDLLNGKKTTDKATWDYAQYTNGFGTKAKHSGEVIGVDEAHKRFDSDWGKAENVVENFKPNLPFGVKAALTSLTFNSGEKWKKEGLGQAIQNEDYDKAKKIFLQYNKAGGKENPGLVARRQREVQWFDEGADPQHNEPRATPPPQGMMRLGGPPTDDIEAKMVPQGDRLAQSFGAQPGVGDDQENIDIKGYKGPVPRLPYVETSEQIKAQMRGLSDPAQQQELMDKWQAKQSPKSIPAANGTLVGTPQPGNQPAKWQWIPGATGPNITPGQLPTIPVAPNAPGPASLQPNVPGAAQGGNLKDVLGPNSPIGQLGMGAADTQNAIGSRTAINEAQTKDVLGHIEQGNAAAAKGQTLNTLETIVKSNPNLSMGPTSPYFNQTKRLISNFFPSMDVKGIAAADSIEKLNSLLASESTKMFTNRGTNFDLQTFMNANPNLKQSREGMIMMIDLLKQETEQSKELGKLANRYKDKSVESWNDRKQEYYDNHPLIINEPDEKGGMRKITTKNITTKEERDELPSGMGYITPTGQVGYKK